MTFKGLFQFKLFYELTEKVTNRANSHEMKKDRIGLLRLLS